ncbi:MAG TPA: helix-turn-helix domain-containing protein [Steroidobacteraceae bacterium]|nr:helix-turn-helix domain-containing protein [Steroidobacteraceae bacterium]
MREVVFLLLPNVVLLDVAGPADAFRSAERRVPGSYRLRFVAPQPSLTAAAGLTLGALEPLPAALPPGALLVLTGIAGAAVDSQEPATRRAIAWLRSGAAAEAELLCVCTGSVLAGHAGLLAGRECTTHHEHIGELRSVEPRARVLENRIFVEDGTVTTSAGVTAGLDLALHVIGRQLGPAVAAGVARSLVVYLRRAGTDPAFSPWVMHRNHLHPAVHRVQDAVARDPAAAWSSAQLAAVACTGTRNLARLFAEHARCSPLDYVQLIRFAFARQLVTESRLDLERVAARAGFGSAQQLRRVWARWEGRPPSAFRGRVSARSPWLPGSAPAG